MALQLLSPTGHEFDAVAKQVAESFPHECLVAVFRVTVTPARADRFEAHRAALVGEVQELTLFHGTTEAAAAAIVKDGFNATVNTRSAFGRGTYFAPRYSVSRAYAQANKEGHGVALMCRVLVGRVCVGTTGATLDLEKFDAAVDTLRSPTMYVIPYDDAALPTHVMHFWREPPVSRRKGAAGT